ncbi:MAG: tetratricopeptide repeat protein [Prevotella sp.]|nr:tetratricopeptide repeat protein [Prevotella sp.]
MRHTILFLCLCLGTSVAAYNDYRNARVDSLEAALKSSNPPKGDDLLRAYKELMRGYLPFDSLKTLDYGRKALALSYDLNGLNARQEILRYFGLLHYRREEHDEAIRYFQWALAVVDTMAHDSRYTETVIDDARSAIYGSIANDYNMQDKHHLAIHYYQLALPIFEKYNWLESQTVLYHNIGELYFTMGNREEAERNYLKALERGETSGDSLMTALSRKGLIKIYLDMNDYDKARATAERCYAYYHAHRTEEAEDYPVVLASMVRLNMMEGHQDLPEANAYAKEVLSLVSDEMMFENKSDIYSAAAELAMAEGQWQRALSYALQTIRPDSSATGADANSYQLLAEIYTELGQKDKAREYIRKMHDVMTRYATDHYQSGLSQMEVLYETEKKEARIATLNRERSLYRWLLGVAIVATGGLAVSVLLIIVMNRRKKKLIAAKAALEAETRERRILARDLHDGVGSMLSVLRLKIEGNADKAESLQQLDSTAGELRRTAHHLLPEELLRSGLRSVLSDFAATVPGAEFSSSGNGHPIAKDVELVLYRCAYELVSNALKHARASHIDIQLLQGAHEVTLTVSDCGNSSFSTPHSSLQKGMGLRNIEERIRPYHGTMHIAPSAAGGTEVNVSIPL